MRSLRLFIGGLSQSRSSYGLNNFWSSWVTQKLRCFGGNGLRCGFCFLGRHSIWFGLWEIFNFLPNVKAHPPLGARANVECGVEVVVIIKAAEQGGS